MNDSTFNRTDLESAIGTLLDDATPTAHRLEIEATLGASPAGRAVLAEIEALTRPPEPEDRGASTASGSMPDVLRRLPPGSLALYRGVADLVTQAWADPAWREVLRRDPRAALGTRGIRVPAAMPIAVAATVFAADGSAGASAALPSADALVLPLPPAGRPAIPIAEARRILGRTEFGWLWGPPWAETAVETTSAPSTAAAAPSATAAQAAAPAKPAPAPVPTTSGRTAGTRIGQGQDRGSGPGWRRFRLGFAFVGVLALVLLLVVASPMLEEGSVGGTAVGSAAGLGPWLLAAAAALAVGIYLVVRRGR